VSRSFGGSGGGSSSSGGVVENGDAQAVRQVLGKINLAQYGDRFIAEGFDSVAALRSLTMEVRNTQLYHNCRRHHDHHHHHHHHHLYYQHQHQHGYHRIYFKTTVTVLEHPVTPCDVTGLTGDGCVEGTRPLAALSHRKEPQQVRRRGYMDWPILINVRMVSTSTHVYYISSGPISPILEMISCRFAALRYRKEPQRDLRCQCSIQSFAS
jgi:hypothetical protein